MILVLTVIIQIAICRPYWGCQVPDQRQVVDTDGEVEVDPGQLLDGVTVFKTSDVENDVDDTNGGAQCGI